MVQCLPWGPLITWVATRVSYEASFVVCAAISLVAALGLWVMLPAAAEVRAASHRDQLAILRKPAVWLATGMTVCVFGAMFSVYSYAAEYLVRASGLPGEAIGRLLVVFGVGGVMGNLLAGRWLGRNRVRTVLCYPVVLACAYGVLQALGSASLPALLPVCLLWGAAHTSGLIVSQVWLQSAEPEAPEFATSLYISAANVGVVLGSALGGALITSVGTPGALWEAGCSRCWPWCSCCCRCGCTAGPDRRTSARCRRRREHCAGPPQASSHRSAQHEGTTPSSMRGHPLLLAFAACLAGLLVLALLGNARAHEAGAVVRAKA